MIISQTVGNAYAGNANTPTQEISDGLGSGVASLALGYVRFIPTILFIVLRGFQRKMLLRYLWFWVLDYVLMEMSPCDFNGGFGVPNTSLFQCCCR